MKRRVKPYNDMKEKKVVAQDDTDSPSSVCVASAELILEVLSSAVTQKVLTWQEVNIILIQQTDVFMTKCRWI